MIILLLIILSPNHSVISGIPKKVEPRTASSAQAFAASMLNRCLGTSSAQFFNAEDAEIIAKARRGGKVQHEKSSRLESKLEDCSAKRKLFRLFLCALRVFAVDFRCPLFGCGSAALCPLWFRFFIRDFSRLIS